MPRVNQTEVARRNLAILSILGETHEVPLARIADALGITLEQAAAQTMALACCGANRDRLVEIYNDDESNAVVVYGAWPELQSPVRLTAAEARALDTALDLAGVSTDDPLRRKLLDASATADIDRDELERVFNAVSRDNDPEVVSALSYAAEQGRKVTFDHRNAATRVVTHRLVEPYQLVFTNASWYLEGFDLNAQAPRTFRLDGIAHVADAGPASSEDDAEELASAAAARDLSRASDVSGLPFATLEVNQAKLESDLYRWPGIVVLDEKPSAPGRVLVKVPYRDHFWLGRRVASWGGEVTVIDPPQLAKAARGIARAALSEAEQVWKSIGV